MTANIKRLSANARIPEKGSGMSAGFDLYANLSKEYVEINPHETKLIQTGVAITPPHGYFGAIFARSGMAAKHGLRPANCVGVCDEDYTGEYIVALHNDSDKIKIVWDGERIAQLVFLPYIDVVFREVDDLDETARGAGGFGSTGE